MPSTNKLTTPVSVDLPVMQGRYADLDGYTIGFETFHEDLDPVALFRGLPDDRCQSPHWGIVQAGQATYRWADHEETYGAGDSYYAPPGHLPLMTVGTILVEFTPTADFARTMAVVQENLATQAGS